MSSYVPLWCKSNFSFLEGASHPDELIEEAYRLGLPALAVTDRDGSYGIVRAHVKARELGLKLIVGSQITLEDESVIILLAQDRRGYANLCRILTAGRLRSEKGESVITWDEICRHGNGLIALWGGDQSLVVHEVEPNEVAGNLRDAFGDKLYGMVTRHQLEDEVVQEARLRERAKRYGFQLAAANEVLYHAYVRRPLQDVLTAIRYGIPLAFCGLKLKPSAEYVLQSPYMFARLFSDDPASVMRTQEIADRCKFSLTEIRYRYPAEHMPDGTTSTEWLRQLTFEGAHQRCGRDIPADVADQLEKELKIIEALDYPGYS
jgi:error-prone DNA polymerase